MEEKLTVPQMKALSQKHLSINEKKGLESKHFL